MRRRVAVITTAAGNFAALVGKRATTTIPIVFGVGEDPVKLGLVASLARPGGNLTGINFFASELEAKRLALLHELVPKAVRIAVLVNPANAPTSESQLRAILDAAHAMGLQIQVLKASTKSEIEAAFATLARDRAESLHVAGDVFFTSRRVQLATLAATNRIPTSYPSREAVETGGLMAYTADRADMYRQVGAYAGRILKGAKPADLPVYSRPNSSLSSICKRPRPRPRSAAGVARPRRRGDRIEADARGSDHDETSPPTIYAIWPRALPRCRLFRESLRRRAIRRGRCA